MTPALVVDIVLVLAGVVAVYSGWRQGAWASVLGFVGISAGLVLGMVIAPSVMALTPQVVIRFLLGLGVVILLVGIGYLVGAGLGAAVRDRMRGRMQQRVDSLVGALFQLLAVALILWLVSIPLASALSGKSGQGIRESQILGGINAVAPAQLRNLPTGLAAMLNESGLPPLVDPWTSNAEVEAPRIEVENRELIEALRPSVVHVLGDAESCSRRLLGSGFVTEEDYVITNAHVVAGTSVVSLDTVVGVKEAEVVYYNPDVDIAVLHSEGLGLSPLLWAPEPAQRGQDAVVMGFPLSGPFTASPARIREQLKIVGPDIYAHSRVERDAYTVRGLIQQGNSGGPMIDDNGQVLGVVFGAAVDDSDTGYALTAEEVRGNIGDIFALREPVATGECVSK
ncbi:MarP family serine protease [Corynebacterium lizhenjunii]|uniref:MarP family serine protease n=1 Tax=Corynebacterium lizhenjunii TaxID=2709394 RepID=UPI0013EC4CFE|nr:MarP family serine protease [Corynebacterium lizhenjunii]